MVEQWVIDGIDSGIRTHEIEGFVFSEWEMDLLNKVKNGEITLEEAEVLGRTKINELTVENDNELYTDIKDNESKLLVTLRFPMLRKFGYETISRNTLLDIHKNLFNGIFPFAGKVRDVNIGKGDTIFCLYQYIDEELELFFKDFSKENELKWLDRECFCKRAACYYGDLNVIHPFREGNGRAIRELFFQIGKNAGYVVDLTKCDKKVYLDAVIASVNRSDELKQLMLSIVKPL